MRRSAQSFVFLLSLLCFQPYQWALGAEPVEATIENTASQLAASQYALQGHERKANGGPIKPKDLRNRSVMLALKPCRHSKQVARPEGRDTYRAPLEVMVLGTFHFHKVPDSTVILAPERQEQVRAVVRSLAKFSPTKVALEEVPEDSARLDSLYGAYREGIHELSRNERQQLGFRLAGRLGHERLYPIDYKHEWPMSAVVDYAESHEQWFVEYWERWIGWAKEKALRVPEDVSISERLREWNDPDTLALMHGRYMRAAEVGGDSLQVGANLVAEWYRRNIYIFSNLTRIAEPGDRIVVIIGSGHSPTLRRFVASHPRMRLADPLDYLPSGSATMTVNKETRQ